MQGKKVMVVDDEAFAQQVLTALYKQIGVDVILAEDGKKAYDTYVGLNGQGLSYILMDIMMPVMDGFDSTKLIRNYEKSKGLPACKIIGLSGGSLWGCENKKQLFHQWYE